MVRDNILMSLQTFLPLIYIIGAYLVGIIFEKIVIRHLKRNSALNEIRTNEMIRTSKGPILLLFVIAGVYGAVISIPIKPEVVTAVSEVLLIVGIVLVTIIVANIAGGLISIFSNKEESALPATSILGNIARIIIFIVGSLLILDTLGVSITPIMTALGVGGLAVALALKDTLTNLFSGLNLIASRQVKPGDYIRLDSGEEGYIEDITWRDTIIKSSNDNLIIIPNQKLAVVAITNFSTPDKQIPFSVSICVSRDNNLDKVEKISINTAKSVRDEIEGAVREFEPVVRFNSFSDTGISFNVVMKAEEFSAQYIIKHEFIKRIHKEFIENNIQVPLSINQSIPVKSK
ncbi:MAG: mechanosensitive ion channel family protein [Deltaproteobacteria bacterium]